MDSAMTKDQLNQQNLTYQNTQGISSNCAMSGYTPAFQDTLTGEIHLSKFADGRLAPIHVIDGLPQEWIVQRDENQRAILARDTIIAGFVRDGVFFTRKQLADKPSNP
jgi:hypothetical protein